MFNLNKNKGFIRRDMASAIQETIFQTFLISLLHNSASDSPIGEVE